jgi:hypothetical protein
VIVHLDDHRWKVADLVSKLQHVTAGVPLLLVAAAKLADEAERPMALVEIAIVAGVLVTFARDVHAARKHHGAHSSIGWFDIAAGILLIYEAFHGVHHKPGYMRPQFLSGVVTLGLGVFHGRLKAIQRRRRYVKVDENGLEYRASRFRRLRLQWAELASVDVTGNKAVFVRSDGRRHAFRLNLLANHDEVRKGIAEHARAAGVATVAPAA